MSTSVRTHSNASLPSPAWSDDQETYIGWLATPSRLRSPKTEAALSQELGVEVATLGGWRGLPGFMAAVRRAAREALWKDYPDVLHAIEDQALQGSIQHQRLYLELVSQEVEEDQATPAPNVKVLAGVDLTLVGKASLAVPAES
jgi:hypothetical protein